VSATILPGRPAPLGATPGPQGTNFAVSSNGDEVTLCLFSADGSETRLQLAERDGDVWHGFVPGVAPGQAYGYRVSGPYDRPRGQRYNPAKLLLDPYARALDGPLHWSDTLFGYVVGAAETDLARDDRDSAPGMPKGVVIDPAFTWGDDRLPRTPWSETVIYEVHAKGFTAQHPDVPPGLRGTFAGLCRGPCVVIFIVTIHSQKLRAFARHAHKIRCSIHFHFVVRIRQPARKRLDGNTLSSPILDLCNRFFDHRHTTLLIRKIMKVFFRTPGKLAC